MSMNDDDRPGCNGRRGLSRRQVAAGVVGLAALLGAGAYMITARIVDRNDSSASSGAGVLAPVVTSAAAGPATPLSTSPRSTKQPVRQSAAPSPVPSGSMTVDERIRAARAAAAKDGVPVLHARTPAPGVVAAASGLVEERNEITKTGIIRITTAKYDLTGQRELLWVADQGKPVGDARCTQNFQFSNDTAPAVRPNLLLCWETSARRSVAVVQVDHNGKPSTAKSLKILEREWAKLG